MKDRLLFCCTLSSYLIYFVYIFVHFGFDYFSFSTLLNVYSASCKNNTINATNISEVYGYCQEYSLSYGNRFAFFICNMLFLLGWLGLFKLVTTIMDRFGKEITIAESKNEDLRRQLKDKDISIVTLQGQLTDRGLMARMGAQLEEAQLREVEDERGNLLAQNKYPDYQTVIS